MKLTRVDDSPRLRADWSRLAEASGNIFTTPEWADVWWRHLGTGEQPELLAATESDGEVVAVASMARDRVGPTRVLRFAGHGPADASGPACAPERFAAAMAALADPDLDLPALLAERLPADLGPFPGFVELGRESSPVVDLSGGWEAYLAARSSNFRSQVRRKERKLLREHGLAFRLADAATLEADLGTLFRLHERRWSEATSGAFAGARGSFHRDFAALALERGWLRLWMADVEYGATVAAWYGFRFGGDEWYYQAGREPEWDRSSVGLVLLAHTMRAAAEEGVTRYRLLRGDDSYKDRFATGDEPVVTAAAPRTRPGATALRLSRGVANSDRGRRGLIALTARPPIRNLPGARQLGSLLNGA